MQIAALCARWHQRLSADSRYNYHHQLKIILRMLGRADLETCVPRLRYPNAHPPTATPEEIEKLIAAASPFMRAAIIIARDTGMRRSDLLQFSESHIHGENLSLIMFKTKQPLTLPVSPAIRALLATLPQGDPQKPVLERINGRPVSIAAFSRAWHKAKTKSGVNPKLKPHSLRHTVAVSIYEVSKDLRIVQQALGHTHLSSTIGYLEHSDPAKLKNVLSQIWKPHPKVQ